MCNKFALKYKCDILSLTVVVAKPASGYSTSSYTAQRQVTAPKVQAVQVTTTPTNYVYSGSSTQSATSYQTASSSSYQAATTTPVTSYSSKQNLLHHFLFLNFQSQKCCKYPKIPTKRLNHHSLKMKTEF